MSAIADRSDPTGPVRPFDIVVKCFSEFRDQVLCDVDGSSVGRVDGPDRLRSLATAIAPRASRLGESSSASNDVIDTLFIDPGGIQGAMGVLASIFSSRTAVVSSGTALQMRDHIDRFRPAVIVAVPEIVADVAEYARRDGRECRFVPLVFGGNPPATDGSVAVECAPGIVLSTSGSTGRPKLVPLRADQLLASARNISSALGLRPHERTLALMPFNHIHGLVASLLAPILAGGTVVCASGFRSADFASWADAHSISWFSAVPTILRSVLVESQRAGWTPRTRFRFIRSASSKLPVSLLEAIEAHFSCPVVEAYGMTEASHQICSNTPVARRPGSVGRPFDTAVAVLDDAGCELPKGRLGELAIRGECVTEGYVGSPRPSPCDWLPTGDLGWIDPDGYVWLHSRKTDAIKRGGETIAPAEIEDALLRLPGVAEAISFGVPDRHLGQVVGALVTSEPGGDGPRSERAMRAALLDAVGHRRVPIGIGIVEAIPLGPTGKPNRLLAAEQFAALRRPQGENRCAPLPDDDLLGRVGAAWTTVLGRPVGSTEHFLDVGGDSLMAFELVDALAQYGVGLSIIDLATAPTIASQAILAGWLEAAGGP